MTQNKIYENVFPVCHQKLILDRLEITRRKNVVIYISILNRFYEFYRLTSKNA